MNIFSFEVVDSLPAIYHPDLDLIAISDLHLGLEGSATYEGNYVPQFQLEEVKKDVKEAHQLTGATRLLINGDLKHEFKYNRFSEQKEINEFLELCEDLFEHIIIIEGNHDSFLDEIIGKKDIKDDFEESSILFTHGHKTIKSDEYDTLVLGHEHPALELEDKIGTKEKFDCFLYGRMKNGKKIIVLPSFSKIAGGSAVNQVPQEELLSPVLKNRVDIEELRAIAVDKEAGLFKFPKLGKFS